MKIGVRFPCHDKRFMILATFHILETFRIDPSVPFEGYKWANSELWKRGERIQL
jgi:hypothetical protein